MFIIVSWLLDYSKVIAFREVNPVQFRSKFNIIKSLKFLQVERVQCGLGTLRDIFMSGKLLLSLKALFKGICLMFMSVCFVAVHPIHKYLVTEQWVLLCCWRWEYIESEFIKTNVVFKEMIDKDIADRFLLHRMWKYLIQYWGVKIINLAWLWSETSKRFLVWFLFAEFLYKPIYGIHTQLSL